MTKSNQENSKSSYETMVDGNAKVPTIEVEKNDLNSHVDLCSARFQNLYKRFDKIEEKVDSLHQEINSGNISMMRVVIGAAGTVVAGLLSTIVVLLMNA